MNFYYNPLRARGQQDFARRTAPPTPARRPKHIVVLSSYTPSLVNFRLELLKRMVEAGHVVTTVGPENDERTKAILTRIGVRFVCLPLSRVGLNPVADIRTLLLLWKLFRRIKPDVILPYTMKPIIYGGIAARMAGVASRYFLVTGLGHVFSSDFQSTMKARAVRWISVWMYRRAFTGAQVIFAYNEADAADLVENRLFGRDVQLQIIPGSGVDLKHFAFEPARCDIPVFLLVARLLRDKGIVEYVEAARTIKRSMPQAEFHLLGHFDPNPAAGVAPAELNRWVEEGVITYLGATNDVRPYLLASNVFVLPSYYREGIPRSILEAMSVGRAIITTTLPGCRDTVKDGENGIVVHPRNIGQLTAAMESLASDLMRARAMGVKSREIAEKQFDVHSVNALLLSRMNIE